MFLIAWLFFRIIFDGFLDADLASRYLSGAVLLGVARRWFLCGVPSQKETRCHSGGDK
ncbi:MAG: hypothetical protein MR902_05525 [Campylobacter sp.]|nr:hypothetical protein [Campylobacter sp.]